MDMAVAIVTGGLCGLLGALPYFVAYAYSKRHRAAGIVPGLIAVLVSFAVVVMALAVAWSVSQATMVPFAVTCAGAFLCVVALASAWYLRRPRP